MRVSATTLLTALVVTVGLGAPPVMAEGLLGQVIGGDGEGSGLVSIEGGDAGDDALVNVGLGSDSSSPKNILDVNLGRGGDGNGSLGNVSVTGGNGQGGLLNSGGLLGTGLLDGDDDGGIAGSGLLGSELAIGLDLGGLALDLTIPGLGGVPGGGTGNGGNGNGGGGNVLVGGLGGTAVNCSIEDGRKVLQMAANAKLRPASWAGTANVQIVPIRLCPQARSQVAQIFNASGKIQQLQSAVIRDTLITASLERTRYSVTSVFAVEATGGRLMVYVY